MGPDKKEMAVKRESELDDQDETFALRYIIPSKVVCLVVRTRYSRNLHAKNGNGGPVDENNKHKLL